ncbi:MAG: hypothetical protein A2991_01425 [Candidatus Terrybacteria bacterium RIFCSPLOWO2_01_FULL_58_14]|uniref:DUF5667 domain-containing protein n=2 Tax=Candidatus Terryibacteriota TaxID=1817920 RepID=A0A1G2PY14_9BACT|nr:MAG: hypothetical protein A2682_01490 [Candidatus Terrybacteria bacterium RIFCSPHIGHO2_01_FULL_58_15]OHA53193.1 MAG: hypothetical protein A2991_01425 [Candidatus Terrybacteria bacterium RIFCSPLOWO2_01_FULL_58_14]
MLRIIGSLRPTLIATLAVSAALFAPAFPGQPAARDQQPAASGASGDAAETTAPSATQSPPSLLAQLFGAAAVDPHFTLPNTGTAPSLTTDSPQRASSREPENEPARSIYRYLVASSDIGFASDPSRMGLALATAEQGSTEGLDRIVGELERQREAFLALVPPLELRETHEQSARAISSYLELLKRARNGSPGGVLEAWNSPERSSIAADAASVTGELRRIVEQHNIALPSGVLP